jgi:hypothetical protein
MPRLTMLESVHDPENHSLITDKFNTEDPLGKIDGKDYSVGEFVKLLESIIHFLELYLNERLDSTYHVKL